MANIGGPKDPKFGGAGGGAKILQFREARPVEIAEKPATTPPAEEKARQGGVHDVIDANGPSVVRDGVPDGLSGEIVRGTGVKARLAALGVKGSEGLIKTAPRVGIKDLPGVGKLWDGNATIESAEGLKKLEGVVRVSGDLVIQESACKSVDFTALKSLVEVGGRLIIEGNAAVSALDALDSLERAKGIYIGFNTSLTRLSLPKLKELDAALIVEGNPNLTEINLPSFQKGGMYLHVHDNAALSSVSLPSLQKLGEELSLVDNPKLTKVAVAQASKPAEVSGLELAHNGSAAFSHLHARSA